MAKLRRNHSRNNKKSGPSMIRVIMFMAVLLFVLYHLYQGTINTDEGKGSLNVPVIGIENSSTHTKDYYPCGDRGDLVEHKYYSLSYNESAEQANWVAYELTKKSILVPNVKREKWFDPDYSVKTGSAFHRDYRGSGYSRGHLAPAGDMAFSKEAMKESFLMSNMSPQLRAFNGGIWNELEQSVRDWAFDNKSVYIVTGPMLNRNIIKSIGKNRVKVPSAFYKVILDITSREHKAIAFIIPNEMSTIALSNYVVTIDELETELGFDLFCNLLSTKEQEHLESISDISQWRIDKKRFNTRVNKWNIQ